MCIRIRYTGIHCFSGLQVRSVSRYAKRKQTTASSQQKAASKSASLQATPQHRRNSKRNGYSPAFKRKTARSTPNDGRKGQRSTVCKSAAIQATRQPRRKSQRNGGAPKTRKGKPRTTTTPSQSQNNPKKNVPPSIRAKLRGVRGLVRQVEALDLGRHARRHLALSQAVTGTACARASLGRGALYLYAARKSRSTALVRGCRRLPRRRRLRPAFTRAATAPRRCFGIRR